MIERVNRKSLLGFKRERMAIERDRRGKKRVWKKAAEMPKSEQVKGSDVVESNFLKGKTGKQKAEEEADKRKQI